jgi:carboxylesterase
MVTEEYESFKASTWQDWSSSIKENMKKLGRARIQKISIVGSSTGGTLLLELISSGYFNSHLSTNLFLVDAIVVPSVKLQSVVGLIGPMLVFAEVDQTSERIKYWYRFRPQNN